MIEIHGSKQSVWVIVLRVVFLQLLLARCVVPAGSDDGEDATLASLVAAFAKRKGAGTPGYSPWWKLALTCTSRAKCAFDGAVAAICAARSEAAVVIGEGDEDGAEGWTPPFSWKTAQRWFFLDKYKVDARHWAPVVLSPAWAACAHEALTARDGEGKSLCAALVALAVADEAVDVTTANFALSKHKVHTFLVGAHGLGLTSDQLGGFDFGLRALADGEAARMAARLRCAEVCDADTLITQAAAGSTEGASLYASSAAGKLLAITFFGAVVPQSVALSMLNGARLTLLASSRGDAGLCEDDGVDVRAILGWPHLLLLLGALSRVRACRGAPGELIRGCGDGAFYGAAVAEASAADAELAAERRGCALPVFGTLCGARCKFDPDMAARACGAQPACGCDCHFEVDEDDSDTGSAASNASSALTAGGCASCAVDLRDVVLDDHHGVPPAPGLQPGLHFRSVGCAVILVSASGAPKAAQARYCEACRLLVGSLQRGSRRPAPDDDGADAAAGGDGIGAAAADFAVVETGLQKANDIISGLATAGVRARGAMVGELAAIVRGLVAERDAMLREVASLKRELGLASVRPSRTDDITSKGLVALFRSDHMVELLKSRDFADLYEGDANATRSVQLMVLLARGVAGMDTRSTSNKWDASLIAFCLKIQASSKPAYNELRKIIPLPAPSTLDRSTASLNAGGGISLMNLQSIRIRALQVAAHMAETVGLYPPEPT